MHPRRVPAGAVPGQALDPPGVEVTVGDQRAVERHADLAAVGVAGHDQVVTVVGHGVDHAAIGGVGDGNGHLVRVAIHRTGHLGVPVGVEMRVVGAAKADPDPLDLQRGPAVGQVDPARVLESAAEVAPGQQLLVRGAHPGRMDEIAEGILEGRGVVVVRAPHVHPGHIEQPAEAAQHEGHRFHVGEIVAGVDHQVRFQRSEPGDPALPRRRLRRHVQVRDLQHAQLRRAGRQHRHLDAPQPERVALDRPRVREAAGGDRAQAEGRGAERERGGPDRRHREQATSETE